MTSRAETERLERILDLAHLYERAIERRLDTPPDVPLLDRRDLLALGVDPDRFVRLKWEAENAEGERREEARRELPGWAEHFPIGSFTDAEGGVDFWDIPEIAERPPRGVVEIELGPRANEDADVIAVVVQVLGDLSVTSGSLCDGIRCNYDVSTRAAKCARPEDYLVGVENWLMDFREGLLAGSVGQHICPCGRGVWQHELLQKELAFELGISSSRVRQKDAKLVAGGAKSNRVYARCTVCGVKFYRSAFRLGVRQRAKNSSKSSATSGAGSTSHPTVDPPQ